MSATPDATPSSPLDSMAAVLAQGFPAVREDEQDAPTEAVESRAQELAMALAASVLRRDVGAFDAFVAQLRDLNEFDQGTSIAIRTLADVANDGLVGHVIIDHKIHVSPALLQDAGVRERLELWEKGAPDDSPGLDAPQRWEHALPIVSHALTGRATRFNVPYGAALAMVRAATPRQQRDVLLLLSVMVAQRIERFAEWGALGHDCVDDYRLQNPEQGPGGQAALS